MAKSIKIILIALFSIIFGIGQAYQMRSDFIVQSIISSLIPFMLVFGIGLIAELIRSLSDKGSFFKKYLDTTFKVFVPVISLCYLSLLVNSYYADDPDANQRSQPSLYKPSVQKKNNNPVKSLGAVDTEFLNADNLYENYADNYTIKFPESFKVNYGAGKFSEVQAYDSDSGYVIIVNVATSDVSSYFNNGESKNEISELMVNGMFEKFSDLAYLEQLESSFEERGLSDVQHVDSKMTNYNGRFYISSQYQANAIINGQKHPTTLIDLVTFFNNKIYHFTFRAWTNLFNESWNSRIVQTMSTTLISEHITNK